MSVINQMLQDLEKRRAGASEGAAMPNQVRPLPVVPGTVGRPLLMGFGIGAVILLVAAIWWWSQPSIRVPPPVPQPAPLLAPVVVESAPAPPAAPATSAQPIAIAKPAPAKTVRAEKKELRLSPSLGVPAAVPDRITAPATVATAPVIIAAPATAEPAARSEPVPKPRADLTQGSIDKQARPVSPRERAEAEYRRATAALSQGRAEEAEESLRAALTEDATFDAARQALVGVLIEQKRVDDAKKVLQDYLNSRPNHLGFAMLLARLQLDRGDGAGAVATMQHTLPYAGDNADFLGFSAAVLQRAGRHPEAVDQYRAALRLKPDAPVWWMGLGISLQASDHNGDALDAYKRALSTGSLSPELQAFVEQKIKQVTP